MNLKRWSKEDSEFVIENVQKLTISEMAEKVQKTERAVKLFLHRNKVGYGRQVKRNLCLELIKIRFVHPEYFSPTKKFYDATGINQVRWWHLYHGRKQITQDEYLAIANHLKISLQEAFESRQLNLFTEDNE